MAARRRLIGRSEASAAVMTPRLYASSDAIYSRRYCKRGQKRHVQLQPPGQWIKPGRAQLPPASCAHSQSHSEFFMPARPCEHVERRRGDLCWRWQLIKLSRTRSTPSIILGGVSLPLKMQLLGELHCANAPLPRDCMRDLNLHQHKKNLLAPCN